MDLGSAIMAVIIALVVKGTVMVVAGWLLLRVYQSVATKPTARPWLLLPDEARPEVRILWWSLLCFAISEVTCGVEIYVIFRSSPILSGTHSLVSGLGMALFALGLYLHFDKQLVTFGSDRCLVNRICRGCTIREPAGCKFRTLILILGTFLTLAAIVPWFVSVERMNANVAAYALPFDSLNAWYDRVVVPWLTSNVPGYQPSGVAYYLPTSMLVIEFRLLPALSMLGGIYSVAEGRRGREGRALAIMAFSAGLLTYSYFEIILYRATGDVLFGSLAHEVAELWFLIATAELLRRSFGSRRKTPDAAVTAGGGAAHPLPVLPPEA